MIYYKIKIKSVGKYLPSYIFKNIDVPGVTEESDKWISSRLGIKARRIVNGENVVSMGTLAAKDAIAKAGIDKKDIGMVIVSCSSPNYFAPSVSNQIIYSLGIKAPAFDINAVCSGFIYALDIACKEMNSGTKYVLVIATEAYSTITDWQHRDNIYFGDGAGAMIIGRGDSQMGINLYADGESDDAFIVKAGGHYEMKGRKVYDRATKELPHMVFRALSEMKMRMADIDYLIPHQAGILVIEKLASMIDIPMDNVITVMDKYANLASASIPVAMNELYSLERKFLMVAIGSGWTYGTAIYKP